VPRSIAQAALARRAALLSINAAADPRFGGQSVVKQRVRSAMCAPLLAGDGPRARRALRRQHRRHAPVRRGRSRLPRRVRGIAGAAIENGRLAERLRREALARGNFERYFAPQLPARIASRASPRGPAASGAPWPCCSATCAGFTRCRRSSRRRHGGAAQPST
jgi:hypothetical protein